MTTISYKSRTERFYDDFERELHKTGLREAIAELTRRLDALESQQTSAPSANTELVQNGSKLVVENAPPTPKRKRGRKPGFRQPWSEARHEAHRLKKARRLEEIRNNPRAQALISALSGMTGKSTQIPNGEPTLAPSAPQMPS